MREPYNAIEATLSRKPRWVETLGGTMSDPADSSEELDRYRAIVEYARIAICEITSDAELLWINRSFTESFGWQPAELLGKNVFELIHSEDRDAVDSVRSEAMATLRPAELSFRFRHRDGSFRWVEIGGRPYRTGSGEVRAVVTARDVTDRVGAERSMCEQRDVELRIEALSRRFLALDTDEFDVGFEEALRHAGEIGNADFVHFVAVSGPRIVERDFYAWYAPGIARRDHSAWNDAAARFRWSAGQLAANRVLHVPSIESLPPEAEAEREGMRELGHAAYLALPVELGHATFGFLNLVRTTSAKTWSETQISRLHLLADVLASALRRRHSDDARHDTEERLRTLAAQAHDCLFELTPDGAIEYASPRMAAILGFSEEELAELDPLTLVHVDDRSTASRVLSTVDPEERLAYRVRHRDGHWIWFEATTIRFRSKEGDPRIALVLRDVTQAQERQAALERQLEIEKAAARFSHELLVHPVGGFDHVVQRGLEAVAGIANTDRAHLVLASAGGQEPGQVFAWHAPHVAPGTAGQPFESERIQRWTLERLQAGEVVRVSPGAPVPREAEGIHEELLRSGIRACLIVPVRVDGRLTGVLSLHRLSGERDWTEREIAVLRLTAELFTSVIRRRQAEQELAESQRRLLQSQKMEAVGTLAGGIAHDFNNQLTVMLGNARFAMSQVDDPELSEVLEDLNRAAEHCAQLTRSLLAFSRRNPTTPRIVDVHRVICDSAELLRPLIPRSIEFVLSQPRTLDQVRADPVQLQQVLVNLAVNARDAMPDGGRLRIGVRSLEVAAERARLLDLPQPGAYVEIEVADTGAGMEPEVQRRVFEPFFTTKAPGGGTGLGLATAYGIVHESGGSIEIESVPGHGSSFRVLLPRARGVAADTDDFEPAANGGRGTTVLVVEDEQAVRRMARRIFEAGGYSVLDAADGVGALEIFDRRGDEIALVATDLEMPRIGGLELARRLARHEPAPAVLFFSASHAGPREELAPGLRSRFVEKPFDEDSLLAAAQELLSRVA